MKGINNQTPHFSVGHNSPLSELTHDISPSPVHEAHLAKAFMPAKGPKMKNNAPADNYQPGTGSPWLAMKGK